MSPPPPPPRTLIRSRVIRADLPATPDADRDEELLLRGRYYEADCLATDEVGQFMRVRMDKVGGFFQVTKVDVTDLAKMPTVGVITEKSSSTRCFVQAFGIYVTSGLIPGMPHFIGLDSKISSSPPVPTPTGLAVTQGVGVALSSTELLLSFDMMRIKRGANA